LAKGDSELTCPGLSRLAELSGTVAEHSGTKVLLLVGDPPFWPMALVFATRRTPCAKDGCAQKGIRCSKSCDWIWRFAEAPNFFVLELDIRQAGRILRWLQVDAIVIAADP